mgnify:CR=1 FL=1
MTRRAPPTTPALPPPDGPTPDEPQPDAPSPNALLAGQLPDFTPVPRRERLDGWTPERQRDFIEALADTGSVTSACKTVAMSTHGVYQLRRSAGAEEFRAAWQRAVDLGVDRLEDVAMERALYGVKEPYYIQGKEVAERVRYNDRLLMFLLRNRAPDRFGEGRGAGAAKGVGAIGEMEKKRRKIEWRAEGEAERANVSPQEVRASIDRKIETIRLQLEREREQQWKRLSPETRRAHDLYKRLKARDEARLARGVRDESEPALPKP